MNWAIYDSQILALHVQTIRNKVSMLVVLQDIWPLKCSANRSTLMRWIFMLLGS